MHSGSPGHKKQAICRYWAAKRTCFYGDDCQFLHSDPGSLSKSPTENNMNNFAIGNSLSSLSHDLAAMDLADPHHAPDHFFTAPFDSENIGPSTSKLQTLMQRSHSVGGGLSDYDGPPGAANGAGNGSGAAAGRMPPFSQAPPFSLPPGMRGDNGMSGNFGPLKLSPPGENGTNPQAMEFFPGARNTAAPPPGNIKEFLPRNPTGPPPPGPPPPGPPPTSVPPPEFLPNNLSADFPPLRAAQHTQPPPSGPPPPGPGQSNEIADFPEFVPRSIAAALAGHSQVPPHLRNSTAGTTSLGTLGPGGMHNSGSLSAGASPLHSPGNTPTASPGSKRKDRPGSHPPPLDIYGNKPTMQENIGGTTYFFTDEQHQAAGAQGAYEQGPQTGVVLPNFHLYPSVPAHVAYMKPKPNAPSFFVGDELKMDIMNKHSITMAQANPTDDTTTVGIPTEVDTYNSLLPLEPLPKGPLEKSSTFGYTTTCYKAINKKDGKAYCLRRIHGFRMSNTQWMVLVDKWKKLQHSNIVALREVFTTKAFGEHSTVFVHDFHAGAQTLMMRHFSNQPSPTEGFNSNSFSKGPKGGAFLGSQGGPRGANVLNGPRQHAGLLPESLIWTYVVQLSSALRTIHTAGLACRVMDPTKIVICAKSRLKVNCVGIFDVLTFDQNNPLAMISHYQQEDLVSLGKVVLVLACNSVQSIQRHNIQASMELVARNYSSDLKNLILYLITNQPRARSVNDIMPMIGARFYTQLDAAQMRNDVLEEELAKEVQNGRLFRLITKLGIVNERPEFHGDPTWAETGDRYLLKLFRDYLFHQVTAEGTPWIDMSHIVHCLNKLDAGIPEKVCLMSRDAQNALVVSYADLKRCFETTFDEVVTSTAGPLVEGGSG